MTRTAKTFERGEVVEVQLTTGTSWVDATYRCFFGRKWHEVECISNLMVYAVPSRRIRKRSVTK